MGGGDVPGGDTTGAAARGSSAGCPAADGPGAVGVLTGACDSSTRNLSEGGTTHSPAQQHGQLVSVPEGSQTGCGCNYGRCPLSHHSPGGWGSPSLTLWVRAWRTLSILSSEAAAAPAPRLLQASWQPGHRPALSLHTTATCTVPGQPSTVMAGAQQQRGCRQPQACLLNVTTHSPQYHHPFNHRNNMVSVVSGSCNLS